MSKRTKAALCVMGPMDGKKLAVLDSVRRFDALEASTDFSTTKAPLGEEEPQLTLPSRVEYRSVQLAGEARIFEFFVPNGTSVDSILECLIRTYFGELSDEQVGDC